jgi:hypothetical protein
MRFSFAFLREDECNRDLYEAAGAADATACSRTMRPRRSKGRMTFLQHEPSAHAPRTKTIVEFGGNPLVLEVCRFAAARAVFCARANRVREPSRAIPKDAAVSAPRNLRRSIFSSLLVAKPFVLLSAGRRHSRRRSLSSRRKSLPRVSQPQSVRYRGIAPPPSAGPFERPWLRRE